jgi:hypothetical protein
MTMVTLPRATVQQALEALEDLGMKHYEITGEVLHKEAYAALRAALEQQEQEQEQEQEPVAHYYAKHLAIAIWEKHYKDTAPDWTPLPDLMGVLTQIDNMAVGLAPPRREWRWLTPDAVFASDEIMSASASLGLRIDQLMDLVHAVEAKLKEKNHD